MKTRGKTEQTGANAVDVYFRGFPKETQALLEKVRSTIQKELPAAEEVIAYGMPAYRQEGRTVIYLAGWKEHYSLYPATARLVAKFERELEPYETGGKGTIRFPLAAPVPARLIARIARFRAQEEAERVKAKKTARRRR